MVGLKFETMEKKEVLDVAAINEFVVFLRSTLKHVCWESPGGQMSLMEGDVVHRDDSFTQLSEVLRDGLGGIGEGLKAVAAAIEYHKDGRKVGVGR